MKTWAIIVLSILALVLGFIVGRGCAPAPVSMAVPVTPDTVRVELPGAEIEGPARIVYVPKPFPVETTNESILTALEAWRLRALDAEAKGMVPAMELDTSYSRGVRVYRDGEDLGQTVFLDRVTVQALPMQSWIKVANQPTDFTLLLPKKPVAVIQTGFWDRFGHGVQLGGGVTTNDGMKYGLGLYLGYGVYYDFTKKAGQ
jgi:hypothetical protein